MTQAVNQDPTPKAQNGLRNDDSIPSIGCEDANFATEQPLTHIPRRIGIHNP